MKTTKQNKMTVSVKGKNMRPMYEVKDITNRTNKNLWVVYPTGQESKGIVYSMVYSRDEVRSAGRLAFNQPIQNIRSRRVGTWRSNS